MITPTKRQLVALAATGVIAGGAGAATVASAKSGSASPSKAATRSADASAGAPTCVATKSYDEDGRVASIAVRVTRGPGADDTVRIAGPDGGTPADAPVIVRRAKADGEAAPALPALPPPPDRKPGEHGTLTVRELPRGASGTTKASGPADAAGALEIPEGCTVTVEP